MRIMMILVALVLGISNTVFGQEINFEKLANAIYIAEGGKKAVKPYGILKDYCKKGDPDGQCRKGCIQTIRKRYRMWEADNKKHGEEGDFIGYLGQFYAPLGAENDPLNLNFHWVMNVKELYNKEV